MTDIYAKIERFSDLEVGIDQVKREKQALFDSILTPEIKEKMAELDAEFDPRIDKLTLERELLEAEIKSEVLIASRTIKGTYHNFTWNKPKITWDTKALDVYAMAHPEILQFRKEGDPYVSVRRI